VPWHAAASSVSLAPRFPTHSSGHRATRPERGNHRVADNCGVGAERDELVFGEPRVLFKAPILGFNDLYDVTGDGQRFLILTGEQYSPTSATILLNWFEKPAKE